MSNTISDLVEWGKHWRPSGWIEREVGRIGESKIGYANTVSSAKVQLFRVGNRNGPLNVRVAMGGNQTLILSQENAFQLADLLIRAADDINDE